MKKNEAKQIAIMIGVMLVIVVIIFVARSMKNGKDEKQNMSGNQTVTEGNVEKQEDGTKLNTSDKLKETKTLGTLEFSDIRLTSKNGESYLTATVKNTGSSKAGDEFVTITVVDKAGGELTKVHVYLSSIGAGEETTLSSKTSSDFADAYDFRISK